MSFFKTVFDYGLNITLGLDIYSAIQFQSDTFLATVMALMV